MNAGINSDHPSIHYYNSDYPSPFSREFPENFDEVTEYQGLVHDIERYLSIASETGGPLLELCCGTGRVAIPLARAGFEITGVDVSSGMLRQFRTTLHNEPESVSGRITLVEQDIVTLNLAQRSFKLGILAFNSLLCILDFESQCAALARIFTHLQPGGILVVDVANPLHLKIEGDSTPKPFYTRKNPHNGNTYTRFAMFGPIETDQRQRLYGWYDEIASDGAVKRTHYSLYWRPIFRYEIELMLKQAGFAIANIEGGHLQEPYTASSPRLLIHAVKPA